jgi:hypothetical protein
VDGSNWAVEVDDGGDGGSEDLKSFAGAIVVDFSSLLCY